MSEGKEIIDCSRGLCTGRRLLQNRAPSFERGKRVCVSVFPLLALVGYTRATLIFSSTSFSSISKMESDPFTFYSHRLRQKVYFFQILER